MSYAMHHQSRKVLLIGTQLTLRQLLVGLDVLSERVEPVGLLLSSLKRSHAVADKGTVNDYFPNVNCPQLFLDELLKTPTKLNELQAEEIWVSLPDLYWQRYRTLKSLLDSQIIPWRKVQPLDQWLMASGAMDDSVQATRRNLLHFGEIDPVTILNRTPRPLQEGPIREVIENKTVMITGAGGSIGSEIAWRVSEFGPSKIVLVERSENALFEINRQMQTLKADMDIKAVLHDVTNKVATDQLVASEKPDVIYHAAAHKHVPVMEDHPAAAVENNFYGTRSIADAAAAHQVSRFVMISTDKAVNPTSVMGATKRLAEKYVQHLDHSSDTHFCMVRFGNVLGSACSVLPIWMRQLQDGGPLTVTHPEMTRYFMSIPEAAGLVLQSSAYAHEVKGGIFLLDMGEPILIMDMAHRFLSQQGLKAGDDVDIVITGPRPGEKMHEELSYQAEMANPSRHPSIHYLETNQTELYDGWMKSIIYQIEELKFRGNAAHPWSGVEREEVLSLLKAAIPEMQPALSTGTETLRKVA